MNRGSVALLLQLSCGDRIKTSQVFSFNPFEAILARRHLRFSGGDLSPENVERLRNALANIVALATLATASEKKGP
jgi:hypothetical protein